MIGSPPPSRTATNVQIHQNSVNFKAAVRFASSKTTVAYDELIKSLRSDLKTNIRMKADPLEKNVIRSILTEIKNMEIASANKTQDEFKLYDLLTKMVSERKSSASIYLKEGSPDRFHKMGQNELREAEYLGKYLDRLPVASQEDVDARVRVLAEALKQEGALTSKQSLFKSIPWKLVQSEWNASRVTVTASVSKVFDEVSDVEDVSAIEKA